MPTDSSPTFGVLLMTYRLGAGLTQEALAERAGLSVRGISNLERGARRAPYPDTVRQLARALRLSAADRARLTAALPRRTAPSVPSVAAPRPSPAPPSSTNLPAPLTTLVGRESDLAALARRPLTTRLLTLTGSSGIGKTRLALEAARAVAGDYPDGVWLVELAALADPLLVPQAVARALGVGEQPGRSPTETLTTWLNGKRLLLVLDNCEHVITDCATLAETLLRACPTLHLLATSREVLNITGEVVWRVPSLALPDTADQASAEGLTRVAAVQLFAERAVAARPGFAVTAQNAAAVAAVCRRLDGIPLAIELAAARVTGLSAEQIAARLDDRFRLLTSGSRTALPRQRTLQAAIDWSYDLLTDVERVLLRRLSVFAGGCVLEAAEAVGAGEGLDEAEVLDALLRLVDKSLVQAEPGVGSETRYRLLETIRQYGRDRLLAAGELEAARGRHRDWCLALAERAAPGLSGHGHTEWVSRLDAELANLRLALAWSHGEPDGARRELRLATALGRFWHHHGSLSEGRVWLEGALARVGPVTVGGGAGDERALATTRTQALIWTGRMAYRQGEGARADAVLTEAVALARGLGDQPALAEALSHLGMAAYYRGDDAAARAFAAEALALARAAGDPWTLALALYAYGGLLVSLGQYADGRPPLEESLALFRAVGDLAIANRAFGTLGRLALGEGDLARARAIFTQSRAEDERQGQWRALGYQEMVLGVIARLEEDDGGARRHYAAALPRFRDAGDRSNIAWALEEWGGLAVARGQAERAARLYGAAEALRAALGQPHLTQQPSLYERDLAALRAGMSAAALAAAWVAGRALTVDQAVAEALAGGPAGLAAPTAARPRRGEQPSGLTPREAEVAALVARGLSNRRIAAELSIAERTVGTHLTGIMGKLGLGSRVQVATWAVARDGQPAAVDEPAAGPYVVPRSAARAGPRPEVAWS